MSQSSPNKVSVAHLNSEHLSAFRIAVLNVLSTDIAEFTYAQIIDGLPTYDVWRETIRHRHDPIGNHPVLCPSALEAARSLRLEFDPSNLCLDASAAQAFQNTSPSTKEFDLRLIEMTALACHEVAALLFQHADHSHHKEDALWVDPPTSTILPYTNEPIPPITIPTPLNIFYHQYYLDHDQYPNGIADMAGYWAEARIFGGVVLFDRGESDTECKDVYIHAFGFGRPIFQLSQAQIDQLSRYLRSPTVPGSDPPFPFKTFERHTRRVHPWDAWVSEHIFRSRYDRKISEWKERNCVMRVEDYPHLQDLHARFWGK